jgi:hypothetical protein
MFATSPSAPPSTRRFIRIFLSCCHPNRDSKRVILCLQHRTHTNVHFLGQEDARGSNCLFPVQLFGIQISSWKRPNTGADPQSETPIERLFIIPGGFNEVDGKVGLLGVFGAVIGHPRCRRRVQQPLFNCLV